MKGIEAISAKIIGEGQAEADRIMENARKSAAEIEALSALECTARDENLKQNALVRAEDISSNARIEAGIETKKTIASEKRALISRAFDKALSQLLELPLDEYTALLTRLAVDACNDGEGGELMLCAADHAKCGQKVLLGVNQSVKGKKLTLCEATADIRGGVIVRRKSIELNCALETMVSMLTDRLSAQVAEKLFA